MADHLTEITLQALATGYLQLMWIEPEKLHHRGMNVGDVMRMLDGVEAEFVGAAVDGATFRAATGHPNTEAIRMMVATVAALRAGSAAKLSGEDDERVIKHTTLLKVFEKASNRFVHLLREHGVILL